MFQARLVRFAALAALCIASTGRAADNASLLPRPDALEPNVRFWTRIYTEVDGRGGLIHDSENLGVVYEVVRFPKGLSRRARERQVEKVKKRYRAALHRLGKGKRENLSDLEARVLGRWPEGTTDATLHRAARRIRFQLGQADKFRAGLIRSGNWSAYIHKTLDQYGVPTELIALPHVESSYNPRAYSRVGAAGVWQFTRSTGRRYMRVDNVVDERMDPFRASEGAARLLRDNHRRLESWPLAITAYNHGVAGVARAVRKLGTRDIGTIAHRYRSRTFGFASRNFYSEFLAALDVHRDAERYFGALQPDPPVEYTVVEVDHFYKMSSVVRALGVDSEMLRDHNLALRPAVWNGAKLVPRGYPLRIPAGLVRGAPEQLLAGIPEAERLAQQRRDRFHKVRRGETLSVIARRYRTTMSELVALNNLRSRHRIRVGQVLRLPGGGSAPVAVARVAAPDDGIYRVRRGDNLHTISQRFGVSEQDLVRWNRLRNRNHLAVGQRLRVAAPKASVVASAPAAVEAAMPTQPVASPTSAPAVPALARNQAPAAPTLETVAVTVEEKAAEPAETDTRPAAPPPEASPIAALESPPPPPEAAGAGSPPAKADAAAPVPDPDPSNYAVNPTGRVTVQADETLGHYADWLEVSAARLRRLNGMAFREPLVIGRQKKLDFSRVTPEVFEQRRLDYHRTLQEEFFGAFVVAGTTTHVLRRGDSLWYLAQRKYEVPIWLLRQYNPDLDFGALPAGTPLVIPLLEERG
jgi:membrane-bound lytic murein transglycosylase D